jgi:hypothetical protein
MNDNDIQEFLNAFDDFMKHSESEINSYFAWQEARSYTNSLYVQKAKELGVSVEYYLSEFV